MSAMMESSPSKINSQNALPSTSSTGIKRPAPSLLPAFEFSSSPGYPRPSKRQARTSPSQHEHTYSKYPTPIPTSETGIVSSSPPRSRPALQRTQSSVSERAPLSTVPSVIIPENGDVLRMGRSSNSSHYQLSANRLISRVHVEARFIAASDSLEQNKVEIKCLGWNGIKLHCTHKTWELAKGDTFTSETEWAEIMLDVQDARVRLTWPHGHKASPGGWSSNSSPSPDRAVNARGQLIDSSPLPRQGRIASPVSPSPAGPRTLANLFSDDVEPAVVKVYEDSPEPAAEAEEAADVDASFATTQANTSFLEPESEEHESSDLSEPEDNPEDDPDEENDPVVHSFGPFGANISARMASFTTDSPQAPERESTPTAKGRSSSVSTDEADSQPIVNHVANQLAFSRLSSTPLSVILNHLPTELRNPNSTGQENKGLRKEDLRRILNAARCIGEIHREGKDAAGKPLESEYYYIPDEDQDEARKSAVVDGLRKPSLRNCRKQHKQYYWKRPRTP